MTSFLARVDGEPVSLPCFSLPGTFARVNEQQFSMKIFYMTIFSMTSIFLQKLLNKCACNIKSCHMVPSTRANKRKFLV